jgi:hypothetical protein
VFDVGFGVATHHREGGAPDELALEELPQKRGRASPTVLPSATGSSHTSNAASLSGCAGTHRVDFRRRLLRQGSRHVVDVQPHVALVEGHALLVRRRVVQDLPRGVGARQPRPTPTFS